MNQPRFDQVELAKVVEFSTAGLAARARGTFSQVLDAMVDVCCLCHAEGPKGEFEEIAAALRGDPAPISDRAAGMIGLLIHALAVAHRRESESAEVPS